MAQYLILLYGDEAAWDALTDEETAKAYAQYESFGARNAAVIRGGSELAQTSTARSIRGSEEAGFVITDGAFIETKEALGGYYLIEVGSIDEALEVAKQIPLIGGGAEVRPLND